MMTIKVKGLKEIQKKFKESPKLVEQVSKERLTNSAKILFRAEVKEAPIDKGNLRRQIKYKYNPFKVTIWPNADYAKYVHSGTGIYAGKGMIRPKNAKVLAWREGGQWRYAKAVKGQKANPFVTRAWKSSKSKIKSELNKILDDIIKKI